MPKSPINTLRGYSNISNNSNTNTTNMTAIEQNQLYKQLVTKIETLEKDKEKLEGEKTLLNSKNSDLELELKKVQKQHLDISNDNNLQDKKLIQLNFENKELTMLIESLNNKIKGFEDLTKEFSKYQETKNMLEMKEIEIETLHEEKKLACKKFEAELNECHDEIEVLKDRISSLKEIKIKYEKFKDMNKDYEVIKARNKVLEANLVEYEKLKEQYSELVDEYQSLEELLQNVKKNTSIIPIKRSSTKLRNNDNEIEELKSYIKDLEEKINYRDEKIVLLENEVIII